MKSAEGATAVALAAVTQRRRPVVDAILQRRPDATFAWLQALSDGGLPAATVSAAAAQRMRRAAGYLHRAPHPDTPSVAAAVRPETVSVPFAPLASGDGDRIAAGRPEVGAGLLPTKRTFEGRVDVQCFGGGGRCSEAYRKELEFTFPQSPTSVLSKGGILSRVFASSGKSSLRLEVGPECYSPP